MPPTANNMKAMRIQAGLSRQQVADRTGINYSNLLKIEKGEIDPRESTIKKIAEAIGVSPGMFYFDTPNEATSIGGRLVPVLDSSNISAWLDDSLDKKVLGKLSKIAANPDISNKSFAYRIEATSMEPEFFEGDHVILDATIDPWPGAYVLARISNKVYFRKYAVIGRKSDGAVTFELFPLNSFYPRITSDDKVRIVGTMVEHRKYPKMPITVDG